MILPSPILAHWITLKYRRLICGFFGVLAVFPWALGSALALMTFPRQRLGSVLGDSCNVLAGPGSVPGAPWAFHGGHLTCRKGLCVSARLGTRLIPLRSAKGFPLGNHDFPWMGFHWWTPGLPGSCGGDPMGENYTIGHPPAPPGINYGGPLVHPQGPSVIQIIPQSSWGLPLDDL